MSIFPDILLYLYSPIYSYIYPVTGADTGFFRGGGRDMNGSKILYREKLEIFESRGGGTAPPPSPNPPLIREKLYSRVNEIDLSFKIGNRWNRAIYRSYFSIYL